MGHDKAFLDFRGETLLARSLALARAVSTQVSIVGDSKKFGGFAPVVEDVHRDCGPLGGIHAALSVSTAEKNLILAVDLPFIEVHFLEFLIAEASKSQAIVTVPQVAGRFQPLCAIYRSDLRSLAEDALRDHRNKIDLLFAKIRPRIIPEEELSRAGFSSGIFRNLNTPEDFKDALRDIDADR